MNGDLASGREIVGLSPPQALDQAEFFLVGEGYDVVSRTATTLTVERERPEGTTRAEAAPRLVVVAVPQAGGGVIIKVRGSDREGVRQTQEQWAEWMRSLPKRHPAPVTRVRVVSASETGGVFRRVPRIVIASIAVLAALVVVVALVGLALSAGPQPETAAEVVGALEDEGMPIGESKAYTEENDPNELMGRPGQYTGKVIFKDTRLDPDPITSEFDVQNGGSVEEFENEDDAIRRQEYLEAISEGMGGPFSEYAFREGTVLLRLSHRLTPAQADEYQAALKAI